MSNDPLKKEIYDLSMDILDDFGNYFLGFPIYEYEHNKDNLESFRSDIKSLQIKSPPEISGIFEKEYKDLTLPEKEFVIRCFYEIDFPKKETKLPPRPKKVKDVSYFLSDEDFRLLDDFHKEIFGKE